MARINTIKYGDDVNAEGLTLSIYFSGCTFGCKNCFNKDTWDFNYGEEFTIKKELELLEYFKNNYDYLDGVSILGGEPLHPNNIGAVFEFLRIFKDRFPNKNVWLWTGYTYEELLGEYGEIYFKNPPIDVLIDGRFVDELKDRNLKYKGSSNQRIIDVKKSIKEDKIILYI